MRGDPGSPAALRTYGGRVMWRGTGRGGPTMPGCTEADRTSGRRLRLATPYTAGGSPATGDGAGQTGGRFCKNAPMPSWASSMAALAAITSRV